MRDTCRRRSVLSGLLLLLSLVFSTSISAQQPAATSPPVPQVSAVGFTVADLDRSIQFFQQVLQFQLESEDRDAETRSAVLLLGDERLILTEYTQRPGEPVPADSRANDHWFQHIAIIVSDMDRAYQRLRDHKVRHASAWPQTLPEWNVNAAGIRAFYFRDPDGHFLEILQFPAGKGDPRWQQDGGRLFLGIDHTAIVVSDTERSLAFWRDELGLRVAGGSENYGAEQERLNGVFGAHLRITTLRGDSGPGVELLEYLFPVDGRAAAQPIRLNDGAWWHIDLTSNGGGHVEMLFDPDGHAVRRDGHAVRRDGHAVRRDGDRRATD